MTRCAVLVLLALAAPTRGDDAEPVKKKLADKKAEKAIKEYLDKVKATGGTAKKIDDKAVAKVLPSHHFYHLLFRQYPVGRVPPKGLKASNVLALGPDGKAQALTTVAEMERFFKANAKGLTTDAKRTEAARAFLRLGQELFQDGYYTFEIDKNAAAGTKAGDPVASVVLLKSTAMKGGSGTLSVRMEFEKSAISSSKITSKLRPGPRPICQATKLLDADPVVRRMAEQDLLIMGRAAKTYLDEQRKKAPPKLRKAIDELWQRIVETDKD